MEWMADLDDDGLADSIFAVTVKLAIKLLFFSAKYYFPGLPGCYETPE